MIRDIPTPENKRKERFWKRVNKKGDGDCWEWLGGRKVRDYGQFYN